MNKLSILISLSILFISIGCSTTKELSSNQDQTNKTAILKAMAQQESDWNKGDIDAFMEGYWKSEDLSFISSRGPTYGWKNTLDNYHKGYPSKDAMGQLKFDVIKLSPISNEAYYMIGRYTLTRKNDKPTGMFTLVWKQINNKWLIISDHTSADS